MPPGKATSPATGVLARIIAAHARGPAAPARDPDAMGRALERALRHAATPFAGFGLRVREVAVQTHIALLTAIEMQPDQGLVAVLEDGAGRRGLLALSHGMVDALIEVQTTGKVEARALAPRPVTQIDEALSRDYIDMCLSAFAKEVADLDARDWPERLSFGSRVADRAQLTLLLSEGSYHGLVATLGFEGTDRTAQAVLVLPTDPALRPPAPSPPATAPHAATAAAWRHRLERLLQATPLHLEAELLRVARPLGEVQRLAVGDVLPFARGDLQAVALVDGHGSDPVHGSEDILMLSDNRNAQACLDRLQT